ncbi:MAG TPA: hypothetical protein VN946_24060 [Terriglobales bacterium]|jgi:hypothetical protein|nr:hypothetical protein [Terriglobales bacterium]
METENLETPAPETTPARTKRAYKKRLTKSDADKAITQLIITHRYVRRDLLSALKSKECRPGTNARLAYLKRLEESEIEFAKQMTAMGVLPKNVQASTKTSYVFKAHVSKGGTVQTLAVTEKQLADLENSEAKEIRKGAAESPEDEEIRKQLEAEFGSSATGGSPAVAVVPDTPGAQSLRQRIKIGPS